MQDQFSVVSPLVSRSDRLLRVRRRLGVTECEPLLPSAGGGACSRPRSGRSGDLLHAHRGTRRSAGGRGAEGRPPLHTNARVQAAVQGKRVGS